jgi:hypothetical protein
LILLTETIPSKIFECKSKLPIIGSRRQREQSKQLNRILKKMLEMQLVFKYFASQEWIYQSVTADRILETMSPEDKLAFPINVRNIDWKLCFQTFAYGIRRFFIKEDIVGPQMRYEQIINKNQLEFAQDIKTAYKAYSGGLRSNLSYFKDVLLPHKFQDFLKMQNKTPKSLSLDERTARIQLREMSSTITPMGTKALIWFFNKSFRHLLRGLFVD